MENQEHIVAKDLIHGHFYKDLYGNIFCFFDTEEGRFLEYTRKGPFAKFGKLRIETVPALFHSVSEVNPRDYSEGLKEEMGRVKSLEQLARGMP